MKQPIWYTRCTVATASGIAHQRGMFEAAFADSPYEARCLGELGRSQAATHFTHALADSIREGGAIPPLWARQNGADTVLVALTWVPECLSFYVRADDVAQTFADLRGRRLGIPVRPGLQIDFMRVNAHKAFSHALAAHGMSPDDVQLTQLDIRDDPLGIANQDLGKGEARVIPAIYAPEVEALLAGKADAVFAKNAETKYLERCYAGRIRKVYDLLATDREEWKLNANPRIISVSGNTARENPDAIVRYLQVLIRAADWAAKHPAQVPDVMAAELGVAPQDIVSSYEPGFEQRLWPTLSASVQDLLRLQMRFMVEHGYLSADVRLDGWVDDSFLKQAYRRENLSWAA